MSIPKRSSTTGGQHTFAKIPQANIQRSKFDRSCGYKTAFDAGKLIPFFSDEVLPGDTMSLRTSLFGRLATPLHPFMDNIYLDTHFFFVPLRLIWDDFPISWGEREPGRYRHVSGTSSNYPGRGVRRKQQCGLSRDPDEDRARRAGKRPTLSCSKLDLERMVSRSKSAGLSACRERTWPGRGL